MIKQSIYTFLEHQHRSWFVWGATGLFALLFILPAWDHFSLGLENASKAETELHDITVSVANLDSIRKRVSEVKHIQIDSHDMIDATGADQVREQVTQITHQLDCRMRRLTLSDPLIRPWGQNDDPFQTAAPANSDDSNCRLEKRVLKLSVEGTIVQLSKLSIALTRLNRFVVPTQMNLQRERNNGRLRLDIDISLFNLIESFDS